MGQEWIAVTVWGGRVSPVLDVSSRAILFTVQDGRAGEHVELGLPTACGAKLAALANRGVHTLLCGAVSRIVAQQAAACGLRLVPFLAGEIEEVITAYLAGRLPHPSFAMPGCPGRGRARMGGRCRRGRAAGKTEVLMPGGDGTGPRGKGPGTGRGQGPCRKEPEPGNNAAGGQRGGPPGRGSGPGAGQGKGRGPGRGSGPQR